MTDKPHAVPIDYHKPARPRYFSTSAAIATAIAYALLLLVVFAVIPATEVRYRSALVELPVVTKFMLAVSRWVSHDLGWLMLLFPLTLIPITMGLLGNSSNARRLIGAVLWLAAAVVTLLFIIGLLMPTLQ